MRITKLNQILIIFIVFISSSNLYSVNVLTVQDPDQYGSKPGYIDKAILGIPLLGLNVASANHQLAELLNEIQYFYNSDEFDKVLIFSNSDSLIIKDDAINWTTNYLNSA